jgi:hypothetical protein
VKDYLEKAKSSLDFAENIIFSGNDEDILSLKQVIEEKAGSIENERPEYMEPVHNGAIEYQANRSEEILVNAKFDDLGKVGKYTVQCIVYLSILQIMTGAQNFYSDLSKLFLLDQLESTSTRLVFSAFRRFLQKLRPVTDEQVFYDKFLCDKFYLPSARVYVRQILYNKFSYDKFYFAGVNVSTSLL